MKIDKIEDQHIKLKMGDCLLVNEDSARSIFIVVCGRIRVLKLSNTGEEQTIMFLEEGDVFDLFADGVRFVAYQDTEVFVAPKDKMFKDKKIKIKYESFNKAAKNSENQMQYLFSKTNAFQRDFFKKNEQYFNCKNPFRISWYIKLFVKNWFFTIQMVIASFIIQIFSLGMPVFYIVIFDRVFGRQNISALNVIAVGMVSILAFDYLIKTVRAYVIAHFIEVVDKESIKMSLYKFFNSSNDHFYKETAVGLVEKYNEISKNNHILTNALLISSMDVIFSVFAIAFLIVLHWKMALISLAPLIPISIIIFWSFPGQKSRLLRFNKTQKENQTKILEILENNETIRSVNATYSILDKTVETICSSFEQNFMVRFDQQNSGIFLNFIVNIGSLASLYYGAHEVLSGKMSFGVYLAISMLSRSFIGSIMKLLMSIQQYQEAIVSLHDLKNLFTEENRDDNDKGVLLSYTNGQISISDLSFTYNPDSSTVLKNINLDIQSGEKVVLTGKSGSGKTTLIKLIQKLYEPVSGYISLDNLNIKNINTENLREIIGVVFQKNGMFSGSIRYNLTLGKPDVSTEILLEAMAMTKLDEALLTLPKGLETPVATLGSNLSNALIAQIALTRVLIMNPQVLILDNAFPLIDQSMQNGIFNLLIEKYRHSTCIFVTDLIPVHQKADRVVVLHNGQVVEQGNYTDLIKQKGYYYYLYANNLFVRQLL